MLLKDAYIAYQGKRDNTIPFFKDIGYGMPEFCNPFDFFVDTISIPEITGKALNNKYLRLAEPQVKEEQKINHDKFKPYVNTIQELQSFRRVSWFFEFYLLFVRSVKQYLRSKSLFLARLFQVAVNTFLLCAIFFDIGKTDDQFIFIQNYFGFMYNCVNTFFINGMFNAIFYIPTLKEILKREYSAKLYRISSFYTTQLLTMMIPCLINSIIFSIGSYFSIRMNTDFSTFMLFFFLNTFTYLIGTLIGMILGTVLNDQIVFGVSPFVFILFMLGSGFYNLNNTFPVLVAWINYISPYKYLLELFLKTESNFNAITMQIPAIFGYTNGLTICYSFLWGVLAFLMIIEYPFLYWYARKY